MRSIERRHKWSPYDLKYVILARSTMKKVLIDREKESSMPTFSNVISTLTPDGEEVMGPEILLWHYPNNSILNGSLLTVESNHFCVLKSRGAILNVYETGQYPVQTT